MGVFMIVDRAEVKSSWSPQGWELLADTHRRGQVAPAYKPGGEFGWQNTFLGTWCCRGGCARKRHRLISGAPQPYLTRSTASPPLAGGQALQKPMLRVKHMGSASKGGCTGATENLMWLQLSRAPGSSFPSQQSASLSETSMPSENLWLCDPGKPGEGSELGH